MAVFGGPRQGRCDEGGDRIGDDPLAVELFHMGFGFGTASEDVEPIGGGRLLRAGRQHWALYSADEIDLALLTGGGDEGGKGFGLEPDQKIAGIDLGLDRVRYPISADEALCRRDAGQNVGRERLD